MRKGDLSTSEFHETSIIISGRRKLPKLTSNLAYDLLDELETNLSLSPCEDIYLTNLTKHSSPPFP